MKVKLFSVMQTTCKIICRKVVFKGQLRKDTSIDSNEEQNTKKNIYFTGKIEKVDCVINKMDHTFTIEVRLHPGI